MTNAALVADQAAAGVLSTVRLAVDLRDSRTEQQATHYTDYTHSR